MLYTFDVKSIVPSGASTVNSDAGTMADLKPPLGVLLVMSFASNLVTLRKKHHLTQTVLAEKSGISVMQIKNYERNKSQPTLESIKKLAAVFAVTADALIFNADERENLDDGLRQKLSQLQALNDKDRETVLSLIDAYVKKARLEEMMQE
jgi:transcriptional regulator with XRE-family HTH domain